jgi:hypothetical protein
MMTIRPLVMMSSFGDDGSSARSDYFLAPPAIIHCSFGAAVINQRQELVPSLRSGSGDHLKCLLHSPR